MNPDNQLHAKRFFGEEKNDPQNLDAAYILKHLRKIEECFWS